MLIPTIRTRADIERDLSRGTRMGVAPGPDAPRPTRRPEWLKVKVQQGENFTELRDIMRERGLHTVCEEAACPNIYECWEAREATFLIVRRPVHPAMWLLRRHDRQARCSRSRGAAEDRRGGSPHGPSKFAVVTGVARDDLDDGAADHWAETIRRDHELRCPTAASRS